MFYEEIGFRLIILLNNGAESYNLTDAIAAITIIEKLDGCARTLENT
jgi:hypothetical protein